MVFIGEPTSELGLAARKFGYGALKAMNKLIFAVSAIVIMIAGSAARAGVVLTDESLDTITAGAANTDFNAISIVLPGVTLVSQCIGNNCTININGDICNSCQLAVNQSGITVTDASGRSMQWPITWPFSTFSTALAVSSRLVIVGR